MAKTINELMEMVNSNARQHGWWAEPRSVGDLIALCHSELSEALEEHRNGHAIGEVWEGPDGKPEGVCVELADCIIRILDIFGYFAIDADSILMKKHEYNKTRPYRHGKKRL